MAGAGEPGAGEPGGMMMPPLGARGSGGGQADQERMRRAYLPEETESWGTRPGLGGVPRVGEDAEDAEPEHMPVLPAAVGHDEHREDGESEYRPVPSAAVGIGAQPDQVHIAEENEDWRTP
jgi:hypothetical protein